MNTPSPAQPRAVPTVAHPRAGRIPRAVVIATAAVVTGLAWAGGHAAGIDYLVVTPIGARQITLGLAVAGASICGLAGWASLALLERHTTRATPIWTALALAVLAVSIVPIEAFPAHNSTRSGLIALHAITAAILIPGLRRGSPSTRTR